ncbi:single-stranded DNA-binding protein [Campylobacter sp. FMV-PI01]|uniref:Single-stranded DNA-binding protein n=1 Tax=Campylobacter portucalensis TaxID=2608384 RepID=A0A6L5WIF9_9BACT|nr:single-stranded DNA-binding protein [Campylobacter portucalensis]MSN96726.1 single-stranded DNA-binding protein [Campylobacter portucalensis]
MFNKVILVGNLTRDIELRYINSGSAIGNCGLAVTRKYKSNDGSQKEETCFIDIVFWGRTAEVANQYLRKGSKILIEGRLAFQTWQDQNGLNRSKHIVNVDTMEMLGSNEQKQNSRPYEQQNRGDFNSNNYQQNNYQQNQQNKSFSRQNNNSYNNYQDDIKEIDVDADMGSDGNEELPF